MKRLHVKFIKWLSNKFGYKIVMLKGKNGAITIEGNREVLPYMDITGYFFKKEPLSRIKPSKTPTSAQEMFLVEPKPDVSKMPPITKLTPEQLKEVGL
jgi:hypothetical protein